MSLPGEASVPDAGWHDTALGTLLEMHAVMDAVTQLMTDRGWSEDECFAIRLSLEEAIVNGLKHGNRFDPSKLVRVRWRVTAEEVQVEVEDEGTGFDPCCIPNPTRPENLEQVGGRGLFLMRCYTDSVRYNERGNQVTFRKQRSRP